MKRKGVNVLDITLQADEVINRIRQLQSNGATVSKKQVKQSDPELMRNALFHFPSWDHALKNAELL
ncbi:hypothetical protein [Paenibacillus pini]|uniref:hypothetical protein n=1 Tax=Paenibacillus pini TaxID=669461 RepID=UPI00068A376C|nr:hypothetical protein [Paenibacillus pini]